MRVRNESGALAAGLAVLLAPSTLAQAVVGSPLGQGDGGPSFSDVNVGMVGETLGQALAPTSAETLDGRFATEDRIQASLDEAKAYDEDMRKLLGRLRILVGQHAQWARSFRPGAGPTTDRVSGDFLRDFGASIQKALAHPEITSLMSKVEGSKRSFQATATLIGARQEYLQTEREGYPEFLGSSWWASRIERNLTCWTSSDLTCQEAARREQRSRANFGDQEWLAARLDEVQEGLDGIAKIERRHAGLVAAEERMQRGGDAARASRDAYDILRRANVDPVPHFAPGPMP